MGFQIDAAEIVRALLPIFELAEIPLTIANVVDAKVKQPILSTVAKITQLIPFASLSAIYLYKLVEDAVRWHGLPAYPWHGTKADQLAWGYSAVKRAPYADFCGNVVAYTAGAFILATPIAFKLMQIAAKRFHWERFGRILDDTEKTLMTIVKVANIGAIVLGLAAACLTVYPLGIAACSALLALNIWATVSYVWPHRSNASQVGALKGLPNPT
jgi:hypothetical protein